MRRLRRRLFALLPLAALLCGAAHLPAAPADGEPGKPAEAADPRPEGARLRLGAGRFRHGGAVTRVLPLPDGKRLLTIAQDSKARVWDLANEKELFDITLTPQLGAGLYFSISPDGKTLAAANSADRTIRLWGLADGKETLTFAALPLNQAFLDLEFSADGKLLVSSHQDRVFRIWDPVTAKEVRQVSPSAIPNVAVAFVGRVRFFPDGKALALIEDWAVRALDAEDGKELRWFGGHTAPIAALTFAPDNKHMATVAGDRAARVWDLATGKTIAKLPLPLGGGRELAYAADGKTLAVLCNDRSVRLFDVAAAKQISQIDIGAGGVGLPTFALSNDGKSLYVSSGESILRGYDTGTGKELFPVTGHAGGVQALVWSPDGKRLATSGVTDRSIIVWDAATGKILRQLPALDMFASTLMQFAPDGKTLLSYGFDRTVRTWDVAEGKELNSFVSSPLQPISFAFSPDGKLFAVTAADRHIRVWDVAAEKELHRLEVKPGMGPGAYYFATLSFAGDHRTLQAHMPNERLARRWDAVTGKELAEVKGTSLAFVSQRSNDGKNYVLLQGLTANLTEFATGRVRQSFNLPPPPPAVPGGPPRPFVGHLAAAVSPDGRTLATVATDGLLRFWDTGSGKTLVERKGLPLNSRLLAFAPDGKTLATAGPDAGAMLWDVPGPTAEGRLVIKDVTAETVAELWKDLAGEDSARAWQAILNLTSAPKETVPFVQKQLKPTGAPDAKHIAKLIADLDAEAFQERESATEELVRAGKTVEEAVKKALDNKPSAEAKQRLEFVLSKLSGNLGPNMEEVRAARAVEVLEKIGTPEAKKVLEEVAKGGDSPLTVEARSALERLKARP
ncbi:MAG TPA: hypothetical protein VKA46_02315 [Gemmataceae bacterium]|nr:hypothetical protein [Gemmataceae bacterium]